MPSTPPTGEIALPPDLPTTPVTEPVTGPRARRVSRRRRALQAVVVTGVIGAMTIGSLWYVGVPHYRPPLRAGEKYGIDVSNHQGSIDWVKVAGDKIDYAYIKATEGNDFVDKRFADNWAGAERVGITRGAYHFFTLCSSGASQAENFLRTLPTDPSALPPAVDLEYSACQKRPSNATFQRDLATFVDLVEEKTGQQVVVYVMPNFEERYPIATTLPRDRWNRRLFRRPATDEWTIWQASARARLDGISEPVDLDVWRSATS